MNNHQDSRNTRDLELPLAKAVQTVLAETLPDDAVLRVMDRAKRLEACVSNNPSTANDVAVRTHAPSPRWLLAWSASGVTAIAALLLALFLFSSNTSVSFAEMLAAVARRPWVHGTTTYFDSEGQRSTTSEYWVSNAHRTAAFTFGDHQQFEDFETGVSLQYDAKEGTIYRVASLRLRDERLAEAYLPELLDRLIDDKADSRDLFHGERVVKAERHEEEQHGKQWLDYLIHLERIDHPSLNRTVRIRLDRATQLPELWEVRKANGDVVITRFDYPDSGPRNIHELGAPKTAKLIDRVPKGDLARIIATQRADRKRFDAYDAIVVQYTDGVTTSYDRLMNLSVRRVRRMGGQYRVDQLLTAKQGLVMPEPDADMQRWWKENRDRYWSVPQLICDGEITHFYKMLDDRLTPGKVPNLSVVAYKQMPIGVPTDDAPVEWPHLMPEQCSRPYLWVADKNREFHVDAEAKDGPRGTVRVVVTTESEPRSGELARYWFDPQRGYILRKGIRAVFNRRTNKVAYRDTQEYEEFAQSPSGQWYPRRVRRTTDDKPQWQEVTRFFVDFDAEMDSDLFRPVSEE